MENQEYIALVLNFLTEKGPKIVLILLLAAVVNKIIQITVKRLICLKISVNGAKKARSETLISVFGGTSKFIISILAVLAVLPEFGINITALLAGIGILGLAVGMAAREIVADFLSGIFLVIEDQYNIGDRIKITGIEGKVVEITLRRTVIKSDDGMLHAIPNGQIKAVSKKS